MQADSQHWNTYGSGGGIIRFLQSGSNGQASGASNSREGQMEEKSKGAAQHMIDGI